MADNKEMKTGTGVLAAIRKFFYPEGEGIWPKIMENVRVIASAAAIAMSVRTFIYEPYKIPSSSMLPTLLIGDHLFVNKFTYGTKIPFTDKIYFEREIERGDIIVFRKDLGQGQGKVSYIKRVVAVPGDTIGYLGKRLIVNGEVAKLENTEEAFSTGAIFNETLNGYKHQALLSPVAPKNLMTTRVPKGKYVVVGDNRDNSFDSRFWQYPYWGYVDRLEIAGRADFIFWAFKDNTWGLRLNRIGQMLHPERLTKADEEAVHATE